MTVGLIWAQSTSGVIGRDGGIPWRLPEDQARFKELTLGHTVVMGRLTWESLPKKVRPLPGRRNVVLTRQADYMADGAEVMTTLEDALTDDETWVIGGEPTTRPTAASTGLGRSGPGASGAGCGTIACRGRTFEVPLTG